jgi:hypothetical protein
MPRLALALGLAGGAVAAAAHRLSGFVPYDDFEARAFASGLAQHICSDKTVPGFYPLLLPDAPRCDCGCRSCDCTRYVACFSCVPSGSACRQAKLYRCVAEPYSAFNASVPACVFAEPVFPPDDALCPPLRSPPPPAPEGQLSPPPPPPVVEQPAPVVPAAVPAAQAAPSEGGLNVVVAPSTTVTTLPIATPFLNPNLAALAFLLRPPPPPPSPPPPSPPPPSPLPPPPPPLPPPSPEPPPPPLLLPPREPREESPPPPPPVVVASPPPPPPVAAAPDERQKPAPGQDVPMP